MTTDAPLLHAVPQLGRPDTLWLLPAPAAKWLAAGLFSGPLAAQLLVFAGGMTPPAAWSVWWVWAVWAAGLLVAAVAAFWRPGGLDLARWAGVWLAWAATPKRAVWKPVGRGILWW